MLWGRQQPWRFRRQRNSKFNQLHCTLPSHSSAYVCQRIRRRCQQLPRVHVPQLHGRLKLLVAQRLRACEDVERTEALLKALCRAVERQRRRRQHTRGHECDAHVRQAQAQVPHRGRVRCLRVITRDRGPQRRWAGCDRLRVAAAVAAAATTAAAEALGTAEPEALGPLGAAAMRPLATRLCRTGGGSLCGLLRRLDGGTRAQQLAAVVVDDAVEVVDVPVEARASAGV